MNKFNVIISVLALTLSSCFDDDLETNAISFEDQLAIDLEAIDSYLDRNGIEALVHESAIRYTIQEEGSGESAENSNRVTVKYKGTFFTGSVFDQNDQGITFDLANLIAAWQIMIPEMNEGAKITIYAPSVWCYGPRGSGAVPPNTNLIFEMELIEVVN
ncbi:MAG: FKBP-type peptidyl-prolyl cis-trans isomerase [Bacteroidota bacterium]